MMSKENISVGSDVAFAISASGEVKIADHRLVCRNCWAEMLVKEDGHGFYVVCPTCKAQQDLPSPTVYDELAQLEAENARLQARVAELEAQLETAEGWLDDPSGYWGGGCRE